MKDSTEELMKSMKPKRDLKSNFTKQTLALALAPEPKNSFSPLLFIRRAPVLVAIAAILLLSGGVYAATHWPEITSKFSSKVILPSGNKVIGVDTTNCNYYQVESKPVDTNEKVYYEVRKDSSLSDQEVVDMVQGTCEDNLANDSVNKIIKPFNKTGENIMSGGVFDIESLSAGSINLQLNKYYLVGGIRYDLSGDYKVLPSLEVYDGQKRISYSELKPQDSVMLIVRDNHAIPFGEDPSHPNPWADSSLLTVLAIIKVPAPTSSPNTFYQHLGKDFVRTEPCESNSTGFCRVYDFHN